MREQRLHCCVSACVRVFSSPTVLPPYNSPLLPLFSCDMASYLIILMIFFFFTCFVPPPCTVIVPCVTWIWLLPCMRFAECWFQVWGRRTCLQALWRRRCAASLVSTCLVLRMPLSSMFLRWAACLLFSLTTFNILCVFCSLDTSLKCIYLCLLVFRVYLIGGLSATLLSQTVLSVLLFCLKLLWFASSG